MPTELRIVPVVGAAPSIYWDLWIGDTPRAHTVSDDAWPVFADLVTAFAARGFPATFVSLSSDDRDEQGLPLNISATVIDFPLGMIDRS
jgi:hypothetical protein